jgi:hypothetical protein
MPQLCRRIQGRRRRAEAAQALTMCQRPCTSSDGNCDHRNVSAEK